MDPKVKKNSNEIQKSHKSVMLDEKAHEITKISYPLSFLLLESEEDSFVKGYN
jgi:hypothetical protein